MWPLRCPQVWHKTLPRLQIAIACAWRRDVNTPQAPCSPCPISVVTTLFERESQGYCVHLPSNVIPMLNVITSQHASHVQTAKIDKLIMTSHSCIFEVSGIILYIEQRPLQRVQINNSRCLEHYDINHYHRYCQKRVAPGECGSLSRPTYFNLQYRGTNIAITTDHGYKLHNDVSFRFHSPCTVTRRVALRVDLKRAERPIVPNRASLSQPNLPFLVPFRVWGPANAESTVTERLTTSSPSPSPFQI